MYYCRGDSCRPGHVLAARRSRDWGDAIMSKRIAWGACILGGLSLAGVAGAAPPVAYDDWTVSAGNIDSTTSCGGASVVSCRTLAADTGFLYEEVKTTDYTYLRLILADSDTDGAPTTRKFTTETYIPFATEGSGIRQGIASKQVIRDPANNFELTAEVQKADLRVNTSIASEAFSVRLAQTLSDAEMNSGFNYENFTQYPPWYQPGLTAPDSNTVMGERLDITQDVLVGDPGDTTKKQVFDARKRRGYEGYSPSAWWGLLDPITQAGGVTFADGTSVSWVDGEDVATVWFAQSDNVNPGASGVSVAFQRVDNNSSATSGQDVGFDLAQPLNPFVWDATTFGTEPVFP